MTAYAAPRTDPTSVMGRRIGAYLIDSIILAVIVLAFAIPAFNSAAVSAPSGTVECGSSSRNTINDGPGTSSGINLCFDDGTTVKYIPKNDAGGFLVKIYGLAAVIGLLDLVVLQGATGASLGKMVVGLRVVDGEGKKAGFGRVVIRWLLLIVDGLCCALPGLISSFTSKGHRRIGDMAGGTYVVAKGDLGRPPADGYPGASGYGPPAPYGSVPGYGTGAAPGWAPPPSAPGSGAAGGGAWGAPSAPQPGPWSTPAPAPTPAPSATPAGDGPSWDEARNAYIQYDRDRSEWVQWSDDTKSWGPISQ